VHAATEIFDRAANRIEDSLHCLLMTVLTGVGTAHHSHMPVIKSELLGIPAHHRGQCLKRFQRGSRKCNVIRIAEMRDHVPGVINDHGHTTVDTFDGLPSGDFNGDGRWLLCQYLWHVVNLLSHSGLVERTSQLNHAMDSGCRPLSTPVSCPQDS